MEIDKYLASSEPGFEKKIRQIWSEREDLQQAYPDPDASGLIRWAAVNGVLEYPDDLARFYPPIPPATLRETACGGGTEQSHLWTSTEDVDVILNLWELFSDRNWQDIESILDFGCACGRTLQWFPFILPQTRCIGSDVRKKSVDWCSQNLRGEYLTNETKPPLALPDASVDLIYSLSVFSHLSWESNLRWIQELARICKPDGRIILTTCGAFALWALTRSPDHQSSFQMMPSLARDFLGRLHDERFLFHSLPTEALRKYDGVEDDYGQAFLTEQFVETEWAPFVDIIGYVPASLSTLQDFYVLRPSAS